ncbi:tape-measure protein [Streptomyces sp. NPDC003860]
MSAVVLSAAPWRAPLPSVRSLGTDLRQMSAPVRRLASGLRGAASGAGRVAAGVPAVEQAIRTLRTGASTAAASANKIARSTASSGVRRFGTAASRARASVAKLGGGPLAAVLGLVVSMVDVAALLSGLMGGFGTVLTIASVAMTAVNTAMRANPLGFVLGIVIPLAAYLIEYAMSTKTGQRIARQAFDAVLRGIRSAIAVIGPVMKAAGNGVRSAFRTVRSLIGGALRGIGAAVGGISRAGAAIRSAVTALRSIASRAFRGLKSAVERPLKWVRDNVPKFFTRAKEAVSKSMRGIGDFLEGGAQTVLGVIKGPINGLIAFANWVIDGLGKLSVNILGKKFGVDLDKIPMLAEGGVVFPLDNGGTPRISPVEDLHHRPVSTGPEIQHGPRRIAHFREEPGAGPRATAEDLLFLATSACA